MEQKPSIEYRENTLPENHTEYCPLTKELILEKLDDIREEFIKITYNSELEILQDGILSTELLNRIDELRNQNKFYKTKLLIQNPQLLDMPEDFIGDYRELYPKIEEVITETKNSIKEHTSQNTINSLFIRDKVEKLKKFLLLKNLYKIVLEMSI